MIKNTIIILFILTTCAWAQPITSTEWAEDDGSPSIYDPWKITFPNNTITDNGDNSISVTSFNAYDFLYYVTTPVNPTSSCSRNQVAEDDSYFYVCVGTDDWDRIAFVNWAIVAEQVIYAGENVIYAGEEVFYP